MTPLRKFQVSRRLVIWRQQHPAVAFLRLPRRQRSRSSRRAHRPIEGGAQSHPNGTSDSCNFSTKMMMIWITALGRAKERRRSWQTVTLVPTYVRFYKSILGRKKRRQASADKSSYNADRPHRLHLIISQIERPRPIQTLTVMMMLAPAAAAEIVAAVMLPLITTLVVVVCPQWI